MIEHCVSLDVPEGADDLFSLGRSLVHTTNLARLIEMAADNLGDDEAIPLTAGIGVLIASLHDLMDRIETLRKVEAKR